MILQALKEYYDRKPELPRYGFEEKEIAYILTLTPDGAPVSLESTYEGIGRNRRAHKFLVPLSVKRSVGIVSNLLWDNPEYVLGIVLKDKKRSVNNTDDGVRARVARQHQKFVKRIDALAAVPDEGLHAVRLFLQREDKALLLQRFDPTWSELLREGANLSFKLIGDTCLVPERSEVRRAIQAEQNSAKSAEANSVCLITGEKDSIELKHTAIKGVWGARTSGANIVSFNLDAFKSFAKDQGANSPVGKTAAFAYTTALNLLLDKDSKQRIQVGDASTVFWSDKITNFEQEVVDFFGEPPKDDPARNTRAVESLFKAVHTGSIPNDEGASEFYVLGLAPNASRIAIRFWIVDTVAGMADKICLHFEDIRIVPDSRGKNTPSLFRLLVSTATQGKAENIPPHIAGDTMRAILEGLPYPRTLLQATIRRIRAEQSKKDKRTGKALPHVTYERAALIKACINRSIRSKNHEQQEEMKVSLDTNNTNVGYRLGRLFATLEKIQQEASPGLNATIRDRFYGAASSTPVMVFGNLMRLKNHHLAKLERAGRRVFFEKLLGQIIDGFGDFPSHLKLDDQGRFAIGYYHQVQDFYTKKTQ
jgi:CRISPR-associated protein Csd1